jgi:hypothetical protein
MKKFVIFALIAAMVTGVAFAQEISFNAWGRGAFVPLQSVGAPKAGGKDVKDPPAGDTVEGRNYAATGATWGGMVRTDFRVNGNAEFIGFQVQIHEGGIGDLRSIWAKPFSSDILALRVGSYEVDALRGKIGTDSGFEDFVIGGINEDSIFARFNARGYGTATIITSEPMDGLFIGLEVPGLAGWGGYSADSGKFEGQLLLDSYRHLQVGFGYQIPDIGHLRAQWVGGWMGSLAFDDYEKDTGKGKYSQGPVGFADWAFADPTGWNVPPVLQSWAGASALQWDTARIEVAFALTAVDNLTVDLGFKFWLPLELKDFGNNPQGEAIKQADSFLKFSNGVDVGLGANFRADAFAVTANIVANFGSYLHTDKDDKSANGLTFGINLVPTYDLDAVTIGAVIGFRAKGNGKVFNGDAAEKTEESQFGIGGFVSKGLGGGSIKAGLAYKAAPTKYVGDDKGATGSGVFSIPIILEYAFF